MNIALLSTRLALSCGLLVASSNALAAPPSITQQPGVAVVTSGSPATFTVGASATAPLSYQWRHLGEPLATGTGPALTLPSVTMADAGLYDVVVTAGGESTVSQAGRLITMPAHCADQFCLDDSFLPLVEATGASAQAVAADPITGGFYVGGEFSTIDGARRWNFAKFDSSGTIDPSFAPQIDGMVLTIAVQPDGKVLIGGVFRFVNNVQRGGIARLNIDGSLDRTFGNNAGFSSTSVVRYLGIQCSGAIIVGGTLGQFDGRTCPSILRLTARGTRDAGFALPSSLMPDTGMFVVDHMDRLLVRTKTNYGTVVRLLADGAHDESFAVPAGSGYANVIAVQSDGSPIAVLNSRKLVRFSQTGTLDPAFQITLGVPSGSNISSLRVDSADRVLLSGGLTYFGTTSTPCSYLIRAAKDGALDSSFASRPDQSTILATSTLADGRVVVAGSFSSWASIEIGGMAILSIDGTLVKYASAQFRIPTFYVYAAIPVSEGHWLVGGSFTHVNGAPYNGLVRLDGDGLVDPSFSADTELRVPAHLVRQGDGRILVSPGRSGQGVTRLLPDGTIDTTFAETGAEWVSVDPSAIALQPDGKILLGGADRGVMRYSEDGLYDTTFWGGRYYLTSAYALAVQSDGHVVAGGSAQGQYGDRALVRFLPDGTLDPDFAPVVGWWNNLRQISFSPAGHLLLGGAFSSCSLSPANCFAVLEDNGTLSVAGDPDEIRATRVSSIFWQADGKALLSGQFVRPPGNVYTVKRINADGTNDSAFAVANIAFAHAGCEVSFDDRGRLVQVGTFAVRGGLRQQGLARFKPGLPPEPRIIQTIIPTAARLGAPAEMEVHAEGEDLHYRWYRDGKEIVGVDSARLTIAAVTAVEERIYNVEVYNRYGSVMTPGAELVISEEDYISIAGWLRAHQFNPNSRDWFPESDPEGDGVSNLLHYAFSIPLGAGGGDRTSAKIVSENGVDYAAIEFLRKTFALDISYHVEASYDLAAWEEIEIVPIEMPAKVTVRDLRPLSGPNRRFMRVRVNYTAP